jgi:replicative DNA helicase
MQPPNNKEVETATLSVMVNNPTSDYLQLTPEDFYNPTNATIAEAIIKLKKDNKPIDLVTIYDEVKSK